MSWPAAEPRDAPLTAEHPEIPKEPVLQDFDTVHAYALGPGRSQTTLKDGGQA